MATIPEAKPSQGADREAQVRTLFSEIAPRYDLLNHVLSLNIDRGLNKQKSALDDAFKQPLIHQDVHQAADRNANGRGNCRNSVAMPSILAESSPSPALKNIVAAPF